MDEKWSKWDIRNDIQGKFYIETILDGIDGFNIILSHQEDSTRIKLSFENSVHAYRSTDESLRQHSINYIDNMYGTNFYNNNSFFIVENSKYIQWLSKQSYGCIDNENLTHFLILATDSIVDIVAAYEPEVELLK